jgi:hypothetical protein
MIGRLNMSQLARKLGLDRETLRLWIKAKKIPEGKLDRHPIYNTRFVLFHAQIWKPYMASCVRTRMVIAAENIAHNTLRVATGRIVPTTMSV